MTARTITDIERKFLLEILQHTCAWGGWSEEYKEKISKMIDYLEEPKQF